MSRINDSISRAAAINILEERLKANGYSNVALVSELNRSIGYLMRLPSTQPEPLTDKEQRIFLAAIAREIKVCEEEEKSYVHESCEDSLVQICNEIKRKVKDALWT